MDWYIRGRLNYLCKVENLNIQFSAYHFMKEFWLVNANQNFLKSLYPDIVLPKYEFYFFFM